MQGWKDLGAGAVVATGPGANGVDVVYQGTLNIDEDDIPAGSFIGGGTKVTVSVSENEVINGFINGVHLTFVGCGQDAGVNFHVDNNDEINGTLLHGVSAEIFNGCEVGGVNGAAVVAGLVG